MNELILKIAQTGNREAFQSADNFRTAAKALGYGGEAIEAALKNLKGFPLHEDDLDKVIGGVGALIEGIPTDAGKPNPIFNLSARPTDF